VKYSGYEALERRISAINEDETTRKGFLESEIKAWLPGAVVKLETLQDWEIPDQPIRAEFSVTLRGYATTTGRRLLFRPTLFASSAQSFKSATRTYNIFFEHPRQEKDDVTWKLPDGFHSENLPENQDRPTQFGTYALSFSGSDSMLHSQRSFTVEPWNVSLGYYAALRSHFNVARLYDESQILVESAGDTNAGRTN